MKDGWFKSKHMEVGLTGASDVICEVRLPGFLRDLGHEIHLVIFLGLRW